MATATLSNHSAHSAAGVLSLLDENDFELQGMALLKLDQLVDQYWAEISESVRKL